MLCFGITIFLEVLGLSIRRSLIGRGHFDELSATQKCSIFKQKSAMISNLNFATIQELKNLSIAISVFQFQNSGRRIQDHDHGIFQLENGTPLSSRQFIDCPFSIRFLPDPCQSRPYFMVNQIFFTHFVRQIFLHMGIIVSQVQHLLIVAFASKSNLILFIQLPKSPS